MKSDGNNKYPHWKCNQWGGKAGIVYFYEKLYPSSRLFPLEVHPEEHRRWGLVPEFQSKKLIHRGTADGVRPPLLESVPKI